MSNDIYNVNIFRFKRAQVGIALIFLIWFVIYLTSGFFADKIVIYTGNPNSKSVEELIKLIMNFIMALTVLVITCFDRYKTLVYLAKKISEKTKIKKIHETVNKMIATPNIDHITTQKTAKIDIEKESDRLFVPLVISLIPFTSAAMDLGTIVNSPIDALLFTIIAFALITAVDISALFKFVSQTNIKLPKLLLINIVLYVILVGLALAVFILS